MKLLNHFLLSCFLSFLLFHVESSLQTLIKLTDLIVWGCKIKILAILYGMGFFSSHFQWMLLNRNQLILQSFLFSIMKFLHIILIPFRFIFYKCFYMKSSTIQKTGRLSLNSWEINPFKIIFCLFSYLKEIKPYT